MSLRLAQRYALVMTTDFRFKKHVSGDTIRVEALDDDGDIAGNIVASVPLFEFGNEETRYRIYPDNFKPDQPVMMINRVWVHERWRTGDYMLATRMFEELKAEAAHRGYFLAHDFMLTGDGAGWVNSLPGDKYQYLGDGYVHKMARTGQLGWHSTSPENRDSIARNGLVDGQQTDTWYGGEHGVWMFTDRERAGYHADIWEVDLSQVEGVVPGHEMSAEWGLDCPVVWAPSVPPHAIKLVREDPRSKVARTLNGDPDFDFEIVEANGDVTVVAMDGGEDVGWIRTTTADPPHGTIMDNVAYVSYIEVVPRYRTPDFILATRLWEEAVGYWVNRGTRLVHDAGFTGDGYHWAQSLQRTHGPQMQLQLQTGDIEFGDYYTVGPLDAY